MGPAMQQLAQQVCQRYGWSAVYEKGTDGWYVDITLGLEDQRRFTATGTKALPAKYGSEAAAMLALEGLQDVIQQQEAKPAVTLDQVFFSQDTTTNNNVFTIANDWERFWNNPPTVVGVDTEGNQISPPVLIQVATQDYVILEVPPNNNGPNNTLVSANMTRLLHDETITKVFCDHSNRDKQSLGLITMTHTSKSNHNWTTGHIVDIEALAAQRMGPVSVPRGLTRILMLAAPDLVSQVWVEKDDSRLNNICRYTLIEQGKAPPLQSIAELSQEEQRYAALDAWTTLYVYQRLQEATSDHNKSSKEETVVATNGMDTGKVDETTVGGETKVIPADEKKKNEAEDDDTSKADTVKADNNKGSGLRKMKSALQKMKSVNDLREHAKKNSDDSVISGQSSAGDLMVASSKNNRPPSAKHSQPYFRTKQHQGIPPAAEMKLPTYNPAKAKRAKKNLEIFNKLKRSVPTKPPDESGQPQLPTSKEDLIQLLRTAEAPTDHQETKETKTAAVPKQPPPPETNIRKVKRTKSSDAPLAKRSSHATSILTKKQRAQAKPAVKSKNTDTVPARKATVGNPPATKVEPEKPKPSPVAQTAGPSTPALGNKQPTPGTTKPTTKAIRKDVETKAKKKVAPPKPPASPAKPPTSPTKPPASAAKNALPKKNPASAKNPSTPSKTSRVITSRRLHHSPANSIPESPIAGRRQSVKSGLSRSPTGKGKPHKPKPNSSSNSTKPNSPHKPNGKRPPPKGMPATPLGGNDKVGTKTTPGKARPESQRRPRPNQDEDVFTLYTWSTSRQDESRILLERQALRESIMDGGPLHRAFQRITG